MAAKPHVGVIGAGVSGLRCAHVLLQHGFEVTIVEARQRIGGRLYQETLPSGRLVDMGPNWIHGTNDNPILDLANATETRLSKWDTSSNAFDASGLLLPAEEAEEHGNMMWDVIQDAFKHSNAVSADIPADESLADFFKRKLPEKIPDSVTDCERRRQLVWDMSAMWGAFVGSAISTQSLKFFWLEECIEGENLFCAGTYRKILDTIARPALEGANVMLQAKADKFLGRDDHRTRVQVTLADGQELSFDQVVITSPLGWLKRNISSFQPPLPDRLLQAIHSTSYGCLEKVYITFPKPFWLADGTEGRGVRGFIQWLAPAYASHLNPNKWNQEAVELASLPPEDAHPTLLFYTYGDQSRFLNTKLAEITGKSQQDAFLSDFFRPYYSRLPHYSAASSDCQPTSCLATDWLRDELAGHGSYCNFQTGLHEAHVDIETMREGLPDRGLWLAGEHTAPFVGLGTATGAYWSGEAVAKRIARAYGRSFKEVSAD